MARHRGQQQTYSLQAPGTLSGSPRIQVKANSCNALSSSRIPKPGRVRLKPYKRLRATLPGLHVCTAGRTRRSSAARASSVSRSPGSFAPSASSSPDICAQPRNAFLRLQAAMKACACSPELQAPELCADWHTIAGLQGVSNRRQPMCTLHAWPSPYQSACQAAARGAPC